MFKRVLYIITVLFGFSTNLVAQQFEFSLTVSDGNGETTLTVGVHPEGNSAFNPDLDQIVPPPPPSGAFDARIRVNNMDYAKKILNNSVSEKIFQLRYAPATNQGPIVITWNDSNLPASGTFYFQFEHDNVVYYWDLSSLSQELIISQQQEFFETFESRINLVYIPDEDDSEGILFPPVISSPQSNTNLDSPEIVFTGTASSNTTIRIRNSTNTSSQNTDICVTTTNTSGNWECSVIADSGEHTYVAFATSGSNTSAPSNTVTLTLTQLIFNYPSTGFGTLAFHDRWPLSGVYSFNDVIIDYQFTVTSNSSNYVQDVEAVFVLRAHRGVHQNGFGFQLPATISSSDLSVSGYQLTEDYIALNSNGTEAEQSKPTFIVFDNSLDLMPPSSAGETVNLDKDKPFVEPVEVRLMISFPENQYTISDLNIGAFNPFLIINGDRGRELHLVNYTPTDLVNTSYFGDHFDNSSVEHNRYYITIYNHPYAINITSGFDYPVKNARIFDAYLRFKQWVESAGNSHIDWHLNLEGYRNGSLIY